MSIVDVNGGDESPTRSHVMGMSISKGATARSSRRSQSNAAQALHASEVFEAQGSVYHWYEGNAELPERAALSEPSRREALPALFTQKVIPQMERRGARGLVFRAATAPGL